MIKPTLNTKLKALRSRQVLRGKDQEPTWRGFFYLVVLALSSAIITGTALAGLTINLF